MKSILSERLNLMSEDKTNVLKLFPQMVGLSPNMRVLCVGSIDFTKPAEVLAKKESPSSLASPAFFSKCYLTFQRGKNINLLRLDYGSKKVSDDKLGLDYLRIILGYSLHLNKILKTFYGSSTFRLNSFISIHVILILK